MLKVVCEIGKFTIRDAILFHKFCIFNKEYFVFLAHRMFGCKFVFVVRLCVFFDEIILKHNPLMDSKLQPSLGL